MNEPEEYVDEPECDSCGYNTPHLTETKHPDWNRHPGETRKLCDVCMNTLAGNAYFWPDQYKDSKVLKTIAWTTNYLADKINGKARP